MKKNNLINLLESFTAYELNKLHKFVLSPYFNKNKKIIKLFELLKRDVQKNKFKTKEYYFKSIYGKVKYNDQKFRNLSSDLFQLSLSFLAQEEYEEDYRYRANILVTSVDKRELKPLFEKAVSTAYKWHNKVTLRDGDFFLHNFHLEKNIFNLESEFEKKLKSKKENRESEVLKINDNLDYFYMIEKLKYYNTYLSHKSLYKSEAEFPYIDKVLAIVKMHQHELPPALRIYFEIYKTSINPNDFESYRALKILVKRYHTLFNVKDAKNVYESLINFTIKQVNKGNNDFYSEMIDVYSEGINSGLILEKGKLSPTSYRNIALIGLRLERFQWVLEFINDKKALIDERYRDNAFIYVKSLYYFYKKDFRKVIEHTRDVDFEDSLYANISKSMIMFSYYELYDEEALMYFADSFSAFVRRSKHISEKVQREYLNLIKFMKQLNKGRYNPDILPPLKEKIIKAKDLASRSFLLEKLKDVKLPNEE